MRQKEKLMDNVDEESVKKYDDRQKIIDGMLKWLKTVEAHYSVGDNYGTYCKREAIKSLIEEVDFCGGDGEFPWEVTKNYG